MRLPLPIINGQNENLASELEQQTLRAGVIQILLRNVVLPRDEELMASGKKAINGLLQICGSQRDIGNICMELAQILDQYDQHKVQMIEQLEGALRSQLQQQQAMQGDAMDGQDINPASRPQYAQEMSKMLGDLNDQYNQAMDQRKDMIKQIFGA